MKTFSYRDLKAVRALWATKIDALFFTPNLNAKITAYDIAKAASEGNLSFTEAYGALVSMLSPQELYKTCTAFHNYATKLLIQDLPAPSADLKALFNRRKESTEAYAHFTGTFIHACMLYRAGANDAPSFKDLDKIHFNRLAPTGYIDCDLMERIEAAYALCIETKGGMIFTFRANACWDEDDLAQKLYTMLPKC